MKYEVKFSCGHTATVELFGKTKDRERKIKYFEEQGICPCCYKKQQEAERAAEAAKKENILSQYDLTALPELKGTEKQVKWATELRENLIAETMPFLEELAKSGGKQPKWRTPAGFIERCARILDSKWWIDHRYMDRDELYNTVSMYKEPEKIEYVEKVILYKEYKNNYSDCKTKADSYNPVDKTIVIYVPKSAESEATVDKAEETTNTEWHRVTIYENMIKTRTENSVLIKMPQNSEYKGYVFWYPAKLVRENVNLTLTLSYTADFEFTLKKYGKGRTNYKDVLSEVKISADEFTEIFNNINEALEEKPLVHYPDKLDPEHTEALDELKDKE